MRWRGLALALGGLLTLCGLVLLWLGAGPVVLILGLLAAVTAVLDPVYGRADGRPQGSRWQRTDERFIDPDTGRRVAVWFDAQTGERRYVEDAESRSS
jgi:hypothetical protein